MVDVGALVAVGVRRVPFAAVFAAGAVAGSALIASAVKVPTPADLFPVARLAAVAIAAATANTLNDPSAALTDTTWHGRRGRAPFVVVPTVLVASAVWALPVVSTRWLVDGAPLPIAGLVVELVAMMVVAWLIAAVAASRLGRRAAPAVGAVSLMVIGAATLSMPVAQRWLWAPPGPWWAASRLRWAVIGMSALVGLAFTWKDPAR